MPSDRFARVKELLLAVLDLPETERRAYLDKTCRDDPALRQEVESILAHDDDEIRTFAATGILPAKDRGLPQQIAGYRILSRLGEGGMGEVYLAEQTSPVRRRVALKVIKAGMDTRQVAARFEAERQVLALLDHPNVAKVFDAGATEDGRPFFVMEYVPGEKITAYCDRRRLSTQERLKLFIQTCEAVQHAHQRGIIHRDLKPMNILVEEIDSRAIPKVIDFGIAKATAQPLTERTLFTEQGQLIGTPEYMSPEQAESGAIDIDTRSDIYSLGVVLYELLVGSLPFDSKSLREAGYAGIQRILREQDPPRPSTRLQTPGPDTEAVARSRHVDRSTLLGQLRGDLDWIVMKALEKNRNRRYASASEFAADVGRYLGNEPVLARPPSVTYQLGKLVARHRVPFAFAAVIFLLVAASAVTMAVLYRNQRAARAEAEQVTATLEEMLASVDPTKSGRDITVKEMLDQTARALGEKFEHQPLIEARLRHTVGRTYHALGEYGPAEEHLQRAVEIRRKLLGSDNPETNSSDYGLAVVYLSEARYEEAEALLRKTLETARGVLGNEHPETLKILTGLAGALWSLGRLEEAETLYGESLKGQRRALGEEDLQTTNTMANLAGLYWEEGRQHDALTLGKETLDTQSRVLGAEHPQTISSLLRLAYWNGEQNGYDAPEAFTLFRDGLEMSRRVLGEEHPTTIGAMAALGRAYRAQGRYEEATMLNEKALELSRRVLGEEHSATLDRMNDLATTYGVQGRRDDAGALRREQLEISRRTLGDEHPWTLLAMGNVATWYRHMERYREAVALYREYLEILRRVQGDEHPEVPYAMGNLAQAYDGMGRYEEAAAIRKEKLEIYRRAFGTEDWRTVAAMCAMAGSYRDLGRNEEAEALWREHREIARRALGEEHPRTLETSNCVAEKYLEWNRPAEADELLRPTLATCRRVLGEDHPQTLEVMGTLARTCLELGRDGEADTLGREQLETRRRILGEESPATLDSRQLLAAIHSRMGRHAEAFVLLREALEVSRRVRGDSHSGTNDLRYALACASARKGDRTAALSFLQDALGHDYSGPKEYRRRGRSILDDPDLASLHGDPEFDAIVEELRRRNEEGATTEPQTETE